MTRTEFQSAVETFLRTTGMSDRALGIAAVNDPSFVADMRGGREAREQTRNRVLAYMASERERRGLPAEHEQVA